MQLAIREEHIKIMEYIFKEEISYFQVLVRIWA